jgi:dihydrofolate synthase/folylpolyglutamate synthase
MAFDYFAKQQVDIAIIETGLGGRLDSTNIITPILSIITNIGYDHTNLLGNTLEEIAFEKAGIIKNNIPVVIGEVNEKTKSVFEKKCTEMHIIPTYAENTFRAIKKNHIGNQLIASVSNISNNTSESYSLDLGGTYQLKNLQTVLTAVQILNTSGFKISKANTKNALTNVRKKTGLRGRWDIISENPTVIYDVAHNKDGIKSILNQLKVSYRNHQLHFIMGFVNDKDITAILELLPIEAHYYFTNAHIPRALPKETLLEWANKKNVNGIVFDDVNKAIEQAKENARAEDAIVVCGSFFILSEIEPF